MIKHYVLFKFLDQAEGKAKAENLAEAKRRMLALKGEIPEIAGMEVHLGAEGSAPSNYDFILIAEFATMEALDAYQKHPSHVAFGQFVAKLRTPDGRACIDYETEG